MHFSGNIGEVTNSINLICEKLESQGQAMENGAKVADVRERPLKLMEECLAATLPTLVHTALLSGLGEHDLRPLRPSIIAAAPRQRGSMSARAHHQLLQLFSSLTLMNSSGCYTVLYELW